MKAPDFFEGTQHFKFRSFIQSCQLILHNNKENLCEDRKAPYSTSFLIGRAEKWIEYHPFSLTNQDPACLLNNQALFESKAFPLFGDPDEVRKSEPELDGLRMKEGWHVSLYISDFKSLVSRIGDWGERTLIHYFRKGSASRILHQLASHPSIIDSLQDFMDKTWEVDTRYHERKEEKSNHQ
ncbi:hypothetical protein O181_011615 [Austropuccinia psidii MF-1]|uniref:Retrotransposon gag domain-containing protein n=1 Tax=Austropuccinia psidii MF-1 TaxID=1389203 RepID=A0A9Q3BW83_9BASI|nr:hypothetical protein [Austropuccinia psidii MF-1]